MIPPDAAAPTDAAMADAAAYLQISPDLLQVEQVQPRQWPDASLGCPQAGQLYSQVITPGYLIVIRSTGSSHRLEYHTDARTRVMLCSET